MARFGTLTRKGRVVYDRKPTPFKWCDVARIISAIPPADPDKQIVCFLRAVDALLDLLPNEILEKPLEIAPPDTISADFGRFLIETAIAQAWDDFDGFGQGSFGGGGASRSFDTPPSERGRSTGNDFEIGPCGVPFFLMPLQTQCLDLDSQEGENNGTGP